MSTAKLTTRDLYYHLFGPSKGDPVVLMVDACNAALLVHSRGVGDRRPARPSRMNLEHYPNVGVVLSSSSGGETHEWGRHLAGVVALLRAGQSEVHAQTRKAVLILRRCGEHVPILLRRQRELAPGTGLRICVW